MRGGEKGSERGRGGEGEREGDYEGRGGRKMYHNLCQCYNMYYVKKT